MAVTEEIMSMDEFYHSIPNAVVEVNSISWYDKSDLGELHDRTITEYSNDVISTIPSCGCTALKGRYRLGRECPDCNTLVSDPVDKTTPNLTLKVMDEDLPFFNPLVWNMLKTTLYSRIDIVSWMCDKYMNPTFKLPDWTKGLLEILEERSYTSFMENLDEILDYCINHSNFKSKEPRRVDNLKYIKYLLKEEPHKVYSTYLPLPNKQLFVKENTTKGKFMNLVAVAEVTDIVMLWTKTISDTDTLTFKKKSRATVSVLTKITNMYLDYYNKYLLGKPGAVRKHVFGTRSHFTSRALISSVNGRHRYNQVILPWCIMVTLFRPHFLNKLRKRGYRYKVASRLLNASVRTYNPMLKEIGDELIAESPTDLGIPYILSRNPGLLQGSIQMLYAIFRYDPDDCTKGFSALSARQCNADYDGDYMNGLLPLDNRMYQLLKTLEPHHSIPDLSELNSVSGILSMEPSANAILSNYIDDKSDGVGNNSIFTELMGERNAS